MGFIGAPATGGTGRYQVIIHTDAGATVLVSNDSTSKTVDVINGVATIGGLTDGLWIIRTELNGHQRTRNVYITSGADCQIFYMHYNMVPNFSYSGSFSIVTDADVQIAGGAGTIGNWKIRFLTSGTLIFNDLKGQYIDVFLVGGGGNGETGGGGLWGSSGAGGGYTRTLKNFKAEEGIPYYVDVAGRGGTSVFQSGGSPTNPINISAACGQNGYQLDGNLYGGNGGCGGGAGSGRMDSGGDYYVAGRSGSGGSDGGDGTDGHEGWWGYYDEDHVYISMFAASYGGEGQGRTTREFEETSGNLYSPGGAGGYGSTNIDGWRGNGLYGDNSGAGGSANNARGYPVSGKSGIVIVRNSRGQYGFE